MDAILPKYDDWHGLSRQSQLEVVRTKDIRVRSAVHDGVEKLRERLAELSEKGKGEWVRSLPERKKTELEHGDHWRDPVVIGDSSPEALEKTRGNIKWYATVRTSREYRKNWIAEHAKGKIFLDYACGIGEQTIEAAKAGSALAIGIDLSTVSLERARNDAGAAGVETRSFFLQADCENTGLPDNSVDTILCSGMLHHLDLTSAFPEMKRILKPGGKCLAIEALKYNPIIQVYRALTPAYRTKWEAAHIIGLKEISLAREFFNVTDVKYWHFFSLFATPFRRTPIFDTLLCIANWLDRCFLRVFPFSLLAWQVTFEMSKRED
ncbi:class I SAM-dependent methyltransferase [Planctomycetota bacterium]